MKTFIDRAGWCFTGMVGTGFLFFMVWSYNDSMPKAIGYNDSQIHSMNELVASYQEPDWNAIPRISIDDLQE